MADSYSSNKSVSINSESIEKSIARGQLEFLKDRFKAKINNDEYILSYSGGKDSHMLYWFIKEYCGWDDIEIVGVNTSFEIPEIRDRIMKNCDVVLHPAKNRWEIKEKYGIPCFTKQQDEYIYRYQKGNHSVCTMKAINGGNVFFNLNKKAKELTLSDRLHKVSKKCCIYNKELPMKRYAKSVKKKCIIGVRGSEGKLRSSNNTTCMMKNGNFTPLYDFTDEIMDLIYKVYDIPIPKCYNYISRSGCAGCPYGRNTEKELALLPELQRRQAVKYFKESYDVLGVEYETQQMVLDLR